MHDKIAIEMMQRCIEELSSNRRTIDILQPKAEAFEAVQQILQLLPRSSRGMSEDLVWKLKKEIETLKEKEKKSPSSDE